MKLEINGYDWEMDMIAADDPKMNPGNDNLFLGLTEYIPQTISIRKGQSKECMKRTVIHELCHAFIFSYGHHINDEEAICDFFGAHANQIMAITDKFINEVVG